MKTIANHKVSIILILGIFLPLLPATNHIHAQEAQIWKKYTGAIHDPNIPLLPNYGYAGYQLGTQAIPETFSHPVFDVTDYGAVPNDANSDQAAIQAAIDAAEANGSGIVFFPPGEFLINTDPNTTTSITIESSNIILKGSGSVPGGTVIKMKNHMLLPPGNPIWAVPPMIDFTFPWSASATGLLTQDANRGSDFITVQDASLFQGWKYCRMDMPATKAANSQFLEGKTPRSIWSKINNEGVSLIEFHEIESVDVGNNRIYFKDPIVDDMKVAHGWKARGFDMMEGSGFEDIHFKANFLDNFVHHKDYIHDAGWNAIKMSRVAHCWVRRSRFTNVTGVVSLGHAYASSMIMLLIDGNRGHALTSAGGSTRILQGLIWDNTNKGQWHGPNMSGSAGGSVVWRIEAIKGRGFDLHGSFPRTNLIDLYTSVEVTGNGGAYQNLPNHLSGLTIWNQKRVGGNLTSPYNFWETCGGNYCGIAIVNPIVVGYHGSATTFVQSNVKYEESNGTNVLPASLYEAQVEHRLGVRPAWIDGAIAKYDSLKSEWYGVGPMPDGGLETFSNLTLVGWGQETYTGDNGRVWNVNAKGVSGYIDSSKGIYFQSGKTGVTSDPITGGIASFSVKCRDLWDAGVQRTVQLLVNGSVVGDMQHTGSEIYNFTVNDINIAGDITIAIKNASSTTTNNTIAIDDISWTGYTGSSATANNLALNRPVTASSEPQTENPASNAVDGETGTRWSASDFPQWLEVDLGSVKNMDKTELICYADRAYQYTIETKASAGGSYTQVVDRSDNTIPGTVANPITDTFTPVDARYVRITVTGASGYSGAWISLLEFRVFENTAGLKVMGRAENPYGTGRLPNFEMYPNPAFATVELSYRSDIDKRGVVKIVDMKGRALLNRNFELSEGLNRITLKTGHLRSGLYMLRFDTGGEHFSKKLLIN